MENNKNKIQDSYVDTKAADLKAGQSDDAGQLDMLDHSGGCMKETPSSPPAITAKLSFSDLPPEIRIEIYTMVIADITCTQDVNHPVGDFTLCQPALAKVNRMLRREVLHMWYNKKSFGICLYPKRHSEVEQVWQNFVDRFKAHTAGADGSHHLSRIWRLQVELWHPAFAPDYDRYRIYRETGVFPLNMCNGVYIQFGALAGQFGAHAKPSRLRIDHSKTNWADRRAVRALIMVSIVETRRERDLTRVWRFFKTYPFERLVDLVIMIAAECREAARVLHIATSFAPLQPWYQDSWVGRVSGTWR